MLGVIATQVADDEALVGNRVVRAFAAPFPGWNLKYLATGEGNAD